MKRLPIPSATQNATGSVTVKVALPDFINDRP